MSRLALPQPIGIVTGLQVEARIARRLSDLVGCTGSVHANVAPAAEWLLASGAKSLMSFGIAGGLAPDLPPGTLIVASKVVTADGRYPAEALWFRSPSPTWEGLGEGVAPLASEPERRGGTSTPPPLTPRSRGGGFEIGALYGDTRIASQPAEKKRTYETTGALAVDLESGETARIAAAAGVPFAALRAIADPAWRGLPEAALLPLDAMGRPRLPAILGSIMKKPGQIPGLIMTARDTRAALKALLRACRVLVV